MFQTIEAGGLEKFLVQLREELVQRRYRPRRLRKVRIPKEGGKTRQLSIPCIRDRVVQGALKLILEPIFEADFQPRVVWLPTEEVSACCDSTRLGSNLEATHLRDRL